MLLNVVGTGSSGNAYILRAGDEKLLLDAGLRFNDILKSLKSLSKIEGALITHEHNDHCQAVPSLLSMGVNVYATKGTIEAMSERGLQVRSNRMREVRVGEAFWTDHFTVMPFATKHDASEPCGFLVRYDPSGETVLYATDTYYLPGTYPNVNYWIVECNYCESILRQMVEDGKVDKFLRDRLVTSHMSLRRLKDALAANDLTQTRKIVLVHLSDERSDETRMVDEIQRATKVETVAALNGMEIPLELTPF